MFSLAANWTFILLLVFQEAARNLYLCSHCIQAQNPASYRGILSQGGNTAKGEDGRPLASGISVNSA